MWYGSELGGVGSLSGRVLFYVFSRYVFREEEEVREWREMGFRFVK